MKKFGYIVNGGERGEVMEIHIITEQELIEEGGFDSNFQNYDEFISEWIEDNDAWEVE